MGNIPILGSIFIEPPRWKPCEMCHKSIWGPDLKGTRVCKNCFKIILNNMSLPPGEPYYSGEGRTWYLFQRYDWYRCRNCSKECPSVNMFKRGVYNTRTTICEGCSQLRALGLIDTYKKNDWELLQEILEESGIPEVLIQVVQSYLGPDNQ